MTNREVLGIYSSMIELKDLKGFKLAKAIILNRTKINNELIEVIREMVKDKKEEETNKIIEEILDKETEISFITIDDDDIPGDITVEQYSILVNFVNK